MTLVESMLMALAWVALGVLAWERCRHARRLDELEARLSEREAPSQAPRTSPAPSALVPTLISVPNLATPDRPTAEVDAALAQRHAAVWKLAEEGASASAIVRETGLPAGEVEVILGLRRERARTRRPRRA